MSEQQVSFVLGKQAKQRLQEIAKRESAYAAQNWTTGAAGTYGEIAITPFNTTTLTSVIRFESDTGITVPPTVTGGDKGAGTINAAGLYVAGVPVMTAGTKTALTAQQNFATAPLTDVSVR